MTKFSKSFNIIFNCNFFLIMISLANNIFIFKLKSNHSYVFFCSSNFKLLFSVLGLLIFLFKIFYFYSLFWFYFHSWQVFIEYFSYRHGNFFNGYSTIFLQQSFGWFFILFTKLFLSYCILFFSIFPSISFFLFFFIFYCETFRLFFFLWNILLDIHPECFKKVGRWRS